MKTTRVILLALLILFIIALSIKNKYSQTSNIIFEIVFITAVILFFKEGLKEKKERGYFDAPYVFGIGLFLIFVIIFAIRIF